MKGSSTGEGLFAPGRLGTQPVVRPAKRIFKEGSWILLGQTLGVAGSLAAVKVLTTVLNPIEYGRLALGMTVATLVIQCVLGPLANGATRFYAPAQESGGVRPYSIAVGSMAIWSAVAVGALTILVLVALGVTQNGEWTALIVAAAGFAIVSGFNSLLNGIQSAARQRFVVAIHQALEPWIRFLCAAGLVLWLGGGSTMALIGSCLGVIVVLVSQYAFFHRRILRGATGVDGVGVWRRLMWEFSRPFALWGLFTWAQLASDRWALQGFATTRDVGTYAVLFQLGYQPIALALGMIMQLLTPIFYQRAGDGGDPERKSMTVKVGWRLSLFALAASGIGFLVAQLFHASVFRLFVAPEYAGVSFLLPWLVLSSGIFAAAQFVALNLMSQMKTQAMLGVKILTALLGVVLNILGAKLWGTAGVVGAGVIFSVLYFLSLAIVSARENREAPTPLGVS